VPLNGIIVDTAELYAALQQLALEEERDDPMSGAIVEIRYVSFGVLVIPSFIAIRYLSGTVYTCWALATAPISSS
jgi:hypothetical protein